MKKLILNPNTKMDLIQPRHNYAPADKTKQGHIYMPTSLLTEGARLLDSGVAVTFHDENIKPRELSSTNIGINLLGAPYIPDVKKLMSQIKSELSESPQFLLGGQVISGLTAVQFARLFGESAHNGNVDETVIRLLGICSALTPTQQISLIPAYEKIADRHMKEYLSREFSFYVSQGCQFACDFCAAVRTFKDPNTGELRKVKESYRDIGIIKKDLEYLVSRVQSLGLNQLQLYLSNLDVFQTPEKLLEFACAVQEVKRAHPSFSIQLRGLATAESFIRTRDHSRKSIEELIKAGFHTVGFGVDGMTPAVWRAVNKGINTMDKCLEAIRSTREDFGLTPEILMVFGHSGIDTEDTLRLAYEFTLDMVRRYGVVPRPHIAKSFIPGNIGWVDPQNANAIEALLQYPEAFQSLDFTALPSKLTHPDEKIRKLVIEYYLKICSIVGNTTSYTKPIEPQMSPKEVEEIKRFNENRYDR
ncbi:radical SAM protein [Candidatus Micrarchaeota archaeon]|nr:radical SAM protein [Candidatus Micrarchaeota archaeon]